jgi:hypothetical protein
MKEKILNSPDSQPVEIRTEGGPYPLQLTYRYGYFSQIHG